MKIKDMLYALWTRLSTYTYRATVIVNSPQLNANEAATVDVDITDKTQSGYRAVCIGEYLLGTQDLQPVFCILTDWVDGAPTKLSVRFVNRITSQIPVTENRFVILFVRK